MWVGSNTEIHENIEQKAVLENAVMERTKELEHANKELVFQVEEKGKQAAALIIANRELQSFSYIASHDLQEPLRKIHTFAGLIRENENQNLSDKGKDYFRRIQSSAARMRRLIEDLLAYASTNAMERRFEKTELKIIIEDVKTELKEAIFEKHAIIESTELCPVNIISFQFRQLMHNLISNALKFSNPGRPPHIIIKGRIEHGNILNIKNPALLSRAFLLNKNYCHICVNDNGIGFEPEFNDRIFEVFQRLHSKDEYEGTGIGLAIVKKIVENHNGIITASGVLGKGATFDIYIPHN